MRFLTIVILMSFGISLNALAQSAAQKQSVCGETAEFKASWVVGESWGNTYSMTWFKVDPTKSVLCLTETVSGVEKMLFKNTYLTTAKVKFTAGNCTFEGGPDAFIVAELVDEGAVTTGAFKAWRFDDRTKRLRYVDAGKVECATAPPQ